MAIEKIPYTEETREAVLADQLASGKLLLGEHRQFDGFYFEFGNRADADSRVRPETRLESIEKRLAALESAPSRTP